MKNELKRNLENEIEENRNNIITRKDFMNIILFDISESEFRKVNNIIMVILGSVSPSLPLILLFRADLIERINMILLLIILISTNLIMTIVLAAFYNLVIDSNLDFIKSQMMKIRIKININNEKDRVKRNKKFNVKLNKLNRKYISKKSETGYNKVFMSMLVFNIVVGFFIIFAKVISYFDVTGYIRFEYILFLLSLMYILMVLRSIPYIILEFFNKRYIKKQENNNLFKSKYKQISIFDCNNIEL